jgi:hypothetical protein
LRARIKGRRSVSIHMSGVASWPEGNFATLILAGVTLVLVYVTSTLKKATDHLARTSILPKLVLANKPWVSNESGRPLILAIANKGVATASMLSCMLPHHKVWNSSLTRGMPRTKEIPMFEVVEFEVGNTIGGARFKGRSPITMLKTMTTRQNSTS